MKQAECGRGKVAGVRRQAESGKGQDAGLNIHWQVQLSTMVAAAVAAAVAVAGQLVELVMVGFEINGSVRAKPGCLRMKVSGLCKVFW